MKLTKFLIAGIILLLTACAPPLYQNLSSNVDSAQSRLENQFQKPPSISSQPGPLVLDDLQPSEQQAWLKNKISIHAQMPLADVANRIIQGTSVSNSFNSDINQLMPVTLNFSGTREDALNALANQTGFAYTIDDSTITWSTIITRTFDVSFMPGSSKYLVGNKDTSNSTGGTNNTNTSTTGTTTNPTDLDTGGQYSSIEGDFSLWQDLQTTIKGILSDKGKVTVSQATTTITVTDHPQNVRLVENYLTNMNQSLSRQVALDVEVIEINLSKSFTYGIDWGLVRSFMSGRYNITLANTASSQVNANSTSPATLLFHSGGGVWSGTSTFIDALAQQGKVSVSTQPRVVTLNNQVAEIGINTQTTYLAQVSTTSTTLVGTTTTLTPGQVTTGFTLYLLPKIQGNNVYLQISSNIASLVTIKTYSATSGGNSIYAPIITNKRFNQRSLVPSGSTLVLAGFKQLSNEANKSSLFGSDTLGGYGGNQSNVETIVLITPTIVNLKEQ